MGTCSSPPRQRPQIPSEWCLVLQCATLGHSSLHKAPALSHSWWGKSGSFPTALPSPCIDRNRKMVLQMVTDGEMKCTKFSTAPWPGAVNCSLRLESSIWNKSHLIHCKAGTQSQWPEEVRLLLDIYSHVDTCTHSHVYSYTCMHLHTLVHTSLCMHTHNS